MSGIRVAVLILCAFWAHDAAGQGAGGSLRVGTDGDDFLVGTDGDDILDPLTAFGEDQVQGGLGDDILALPGTPQDYVFVAESAGFRVTARSGVNALVVEVERVAFGVTGEQLADSATPLTIAEYAALLPGSSADGTGRPPIALSDTVGGARGASQITIDLRDLLRNDYDPDFDAQDLTGLDVALAAPIGVVTVLLDPVAIFEAGYESALYPFGLLVVDLASPLTSDATLRYRTQMTLQGTSFTDQSSEATVTITPVAAVNDRIIGSFGGETFVPYARLLANDGPGAVFAGLFNPYVFGGTILDDPARGGIVIDFPGFFRNNAFFEYAIAGSPDRASVEVDLSNSPPIAAAIARVVSPGSSFTLTFDAIREHYGNFDPDSERNFVVDLTGPANTNGVTFQILADRVELSFPAGYAGDFVLDYTLSDQPLNARSLPSTISFLTAAPPAPVAVDDVLNWGINSDGRTLFQGGQPGYGAIYSRELLANDMAMPGSVVVANAPLDTTPLDENLAIRAIQYAIPGANGVTSRSDTAFGFEFKDDFTGADTYAYTVVDPLGRTATGLITVNVNIPQPVLANNVITIPTGATSVTVTAADILANDTFSGTGAIAQINANAVIQVVDSGVSIGGGKTRLDGFTFDLDPTRSLDSYQFNVLAFDTEAAGGSASGWQVVTFAPAAPTVYRFVDLATTVSEGTSTVSDNGVFFRIERSGVLDDAVLFFTLRPALSGASADASDVRTAFGTQLQYRFSAGQDAVNLGISIIGDALIEPNEVFLITLDGLGDGLGGSNPGAIDPSAAVFVATILNDDAASPPVFTLRLIENAMPEGTGAGNGGYIAFSVERDPAGDLGAAVVFANVAPSGSNPIDGDDLVTAFNSLRVDFAQGQTFAQFSVQAFPDAVFEADEGLAVSLVSASLGTVDTTPVSATIFNDDLPPPVFRLRLIENVETEGTPPVGGGFAAFTIERVSGAATAATLTYSVTPSGGAPVDAGDLAGGLGDFTISMREAVDFVQFSLAASPDARFEPDETYTVTLTGTTAGTISATENAAEAIIINDDLPPPVFRLRLIENVETEGTPPVGGGFAAFTIERVSGAATAATLTYSVTPSGGAPVDAADLLAGLGTFQIAVGEGVDFVTFSVFTAADALFEPDETYTVTLTGTTVGSISATENAAEAIIINDELPPPVNTPPVGVNDSVSTPFETPIAIPVLANDTDAETNPLSAGAFANLVGGTLSLPGDGTVLFTPSPGFVGAGGFSYRPFDGQAQGNVTTVTVTVSAPPPPCATDVSGVVSVTRGTIRYVRARARFEQVLTLTNTGVSAITGPVAVAVDGLSAHASLAGADGVTACAAPAGSPFETVPVGSDSALSPGETATIVVAFTTTQNQSFTYTTRVLAGTPR